ncbi:unnamed protein product [Haemonchus placei]|uniref:Uncharacterized protein n=1 Tax=Haemonchus placei TaxID=6290 RepID=A0A0N4X346_HAEPC|nr:unnamed protein product [Haemonchus placei]
MSTSLETDDNICRRFFHFFESNIGNRTPFVKGPMKCCPKNCEGLWDPSAFEDEAPPDVRAGMNRLQIVKRVYQAIIGVQIEPSLWELPEHSFPTAGAFSVQEHLRQRHFVKNRRAEHAQSMS